MTVGFHKLVTGHGLSPGTLPTVRLEPGIRPKLDLGLGASTIRIGLGDDPTAALAALRDALDALLTESEAA